MPPVRDGGAVVIDPRILIRPGDRVTVTNTDRRDDYWQGETGEVLTERPGFGGDRIVYRVQMDDGTILELVEGQVALA